MAGLYVHIPFCRSKCLYCDFYSTPCVKTSPVSALVQAVCDEYERRKNELSGDDGFRTVYFGGGTPSFLNTADLEKLCRTLPVCTADEFTIEANPDDITLDKVKIWRELGINRVSLGIQSLDNSQLKRIGRRHSASDALKAIDTIREAGITNISCDLIYALPEQSVESWRQSLNQLLSCDLPHMSVYCLSYEPSTPLYRLMEKGKVMPADDSTIVEMYNILTEAMRLRGYEHYEISSFARPGMRSRHNSSYWHNMPYLGLGPAAHSYDGHGVRRFNRPDLIAYIAGEDVAEYEYIDEDKHYNELVITALRTSDGLDLSDVEERYRDILLKSATPMLDSGQLMLKGNILTIDENSWLVSDAILRDLII